MTTPQPCRHQHAFTLVELLVVIGIIAVLISILMPVLTKVRGEARAVSCASNMRQIVQATIAYATSNDQSLPNAPYFDFAYTDPRTYKSAWTLPKQGVVDADHKGAIFPYLSSDPVVRANMLKCPGDNGEPSVYNGAAALGWTRNVSYSYNMRLNPGGDPWGTTLRITQIVNSSKKLLVIEQETADDGACYWDAGWIPQQLPADLKALADAPAYRHGRAGNQGFADGHVERRTPADLVGNQQMSFPIRNKLVRDTCELTQ